MTIDPDGQTFWYLGEYSKDIPAVPDGVHTSVSSLTPLAVVADRPDHQVNPGSLAATQPPDTTTMQDLDISNVGGADLDWAFTKMLRHAPCQRGS